MYSWKDDIRRETSRYERSTSREYKTDNGLWRNQHSGSREIDSVSESRLYEAIAEYERMNEWN